MVYILWKKPAALILIHKKSNQHDATNGFFISALQGSTSAGADLQFPPKGNDPIGDTPIKITEPWLWGEGCDFRSHES